MMFLEFLLLETFLFLSVVVEVTLFLSRVPFLSEPIHKMHYLVTNGFDIWKSVLDLVLPKSLMFTNSRTVLG